MSAPPPPPPPRDASTAAALVAGLGAEGAELALPAPSLFHVNNKYSHRRPRLVCTRRLPILRPRPFTPRGAWSRGRDRAPSRQSLGANQSVTSGSGRRIPVGREPPGFRGHRAAPARAGRETLSPRSSLRATSPQPSAARGPRMSTVLVLKITPTRPAPSRKGRTHRRRGGGGWKEEHGWEEAERLRPPGEPRTRAGGAARRPPTRST